MEIVSKSQTYEFDKQAIFCLIDWLTVVYNDCTLREILKNYNITDLSDDFEDAWSHRYFHSKGYAIDPCLNLRGINIQFHFDDMLQFWDQDLFSDSLFDTPFSYIRVDCSGSALQQIRDSGLSIDEEIWIPFSVSGSYHVTRCDFAYDLINYCPEFLDQTILLCQECGSAPSFGSGLNLPVANCGRPMQASLKLSGREKTLYIGGSRSARKLRIYDKLLEYSSKHKNVEIPYKGDYPVESWIRIELQTRNHISDNLLYGYGEPAFCGSFQCVFRYIYDSFGIRDGKHLDQVSETWQKLFDWKLIPSIIQNLHSVQIEVDSYQKSKNVCMNFAFSSIVHLISRIGISDFYNMLNERLLYLQQSDDPVVQRQWMRLLTKICDPVDGFGSHFVMGKGNFYQLLD